MCQVFYINYFKIYAAALRVEYYYSLSIQWIKQKPGKFKLSKDTDLAGNVQTQESISGCSPALIHWVRFTPGRNFECLRLLSTLSSGKFLSL